MELNEPQTQSESIEQERNVQISEHTTEIEYSDEDDIVSDELQLKEEINEFGPEDELLSDEEEIYSDEDEQEIESGNAESAETDETESSDVDDSDLLKRLDAKYGKLPCHSDEDEDIDNDPTWTSTYFKQKQSKAKTNQKQNKIKYSNVGLK